MIRKPDKKSLDTHLQRGKEVSQKTEPLEIMFTPDKAGTSITPTKIAKRKAVVLKSHIDFITARLLGEKFKSKLFAKMNSRKHNPDQVELVAIDRYYEQYLVVGGKYAIDYCKRLVFTIKVAGNAQAVTILDKKLKPKHSNEASSNGQKIIKLNCTEHFHYEDKTSFILDKTGREVDLEQLRFPQFKKQIDDKTAKSIINISDVKSSSEEEVKLLKSKIVKRPLDVGEIIKEIFEVNDRILVYCPMYQLTFRNSKTKKEITLKLDGIEGKIVSSESGEITTQKPVKISIESHNDFISHTEVEPINGEPQPQEPEDTLDSRNATNQTDTDLNNVKPCLDFPAKVVGEVFHVGDNVTAIVGDLEIPSGTTVSETLVVKGNLKTGTNCKLLGRVKALKDVTIGENTTINGKVVSGRNVTLGRNSIIHGSLESEGDVKINKRAIIEGGAIIKVFSQTRPICHSFGDNQCR